MALIEGQHYVKCGDGCGRNIAFEVFDEGYPTKQQPSGFLCSCDEWTSNDCGDARELRCDTCEAYYRAQELTTVAKSIEDAIQSADIKRARIAAAGIDVLVNDVKARINVLHERRGQPASGCSTDCNECRTQGQAVA